MNREEFERKLLDLLYLAEELNENPIFGKELRDIAQKNNLMGLPELIDHLDRLYVAFPITKEGESDE